jgi:transposase
MSRAQRVEVRLSAEERRELEEMVKKMVCGERKYKRARTLLLLDRSQGRKRSGKEVAEEVDLRPGTVGKIAQRYEAGGVAGAMEELPRPGRGVKITGEVEAQLIALACQKPEAGSGQAKWTMRMLADRLVELGLVDSISHVAVMNRLKKTRSNPGRSKAGASHRKRTPCS